MTGGNAVAVDLVKRVAVDLVKRVSAPRRAAEDQTGVSGPSSVTY